MPARMKTLPARIRVQAPSRWPADVRPPVTLTTHSRATPSVLVLLVVLLLAGCGARDELPEPPLGVQSLAVGSGMSWAVLSGGTAMGWGDDGWGQLGDGDAHWGCASMDPG